MCVCVCVCLVTARKHTNRIADDHLSSARTSARAYARRGVGASGYRARARADYRRGTRDEAPDAVGVGRRGGAGEEQQEKEEDDDNDADDDEGEVKVRERPSARWWWWRQTVKSPCTYRNSIGWKSDISIVDVEARTC